MDFLEKALDKMSNLEPPRVQAKEPEPALELVDIPSTMTTNEIVYTHTQRILPNLEIIRDRRVVAMQKHDPIADYFRMLRTKVLKQLRTNNWNSIAVTSPTRGVGKSMIAANLAISIAMEVNQTVLLVDFDLRLPKMAWYFDFDVKYGLIDCLTDDIPLNEILINPSVDRLVVLPGRGATNASSEIISSPKMQQLVADIKSRYHSRIIIFDMPPVLAIDDVLAASDYYDAALLVVEDGVSNSVEINKSLKMLSNTNLLGVVLNKAQSLPNHQGYY